MPQRDKFFRTRRQQALDYGTSAIHEESDTRRARQAQAAQERAVREKAAAAFKEGDRVKTPDGFTGRVESITRNSSVDVRLDRLRTTRHYAATQLTKI